MSDIQVYLDEIRNALYGEEVRSSIIGAINQCYQDAADGVKPSIEFSEVQNGTRVTIRVGDEADSFNVINGARTQLMTQIYTSASTTCAANSNGTVNIPAAFPEGYDYVAVIDVWSSGSVVSYSTTTTLTDGGNVVVNWINTASASETVTFSVKVLYIYHIEEAAGDDVIRNTMYPVGSVYISTNSANPSLLFGGTWRQIGQGRTLIGVGSIEENTTTDHGTVTAGSFTPAVNERGGTLSHRHYMHGLDADGPRAAIGATDASPNRIGYKAVEPSAFGPGSTDAYVVQGTNVTGGTSHTFSHYTPVYGYTQGSSGMEPYLAVYIWERTE